MKPVYTDDQLSFLRSEYQHLMLSGLTEAFNNKFGTDKTTGQIKSTLKRYEIRCGRKGQQKGLLWAYTPEQASFIDQRYKKLSLADLTSAFNKAFDTKKTETQIRGFTRNHRIHSGRDGHFETGHQPWNTGTKGLVKPNSGNFIKGHTPRNTKPLGHERICKKDGYILIKVSEPNPYTGASTRYRAKHQVIWEKANGPIQKGYNVQFIDGNRQNCDLDNLVLISRAESCYLNKNGYADLPEELKPSMQALAKLITRQKQLEKNPAHNEMQLTRHAQERWQERFQELDPEHEFARARRRLGKKMRKRVRASCPAHLQYIGKSFNGRYMRMTPDGIVFVVAPPETIITVLRFQEMKPLFIPLKSQYYDEFERGLKCVELRLYGPRWNEKNCCIGREVVLSKGYGKHSRMHGKIAFFTKVHGTDLNRKNKQDVMAVYGTLDVQLAFIGISELRSQA